MLALSFEFSPLTEPSEDAFKIDPPRKCVCAEVNVVELDRMLGALRRADTERGAKALVVAIVQDDAT